ncbi:hypothetical protein ACR3IF_29865 [Pseudomonas aeruginosa]|uniref:hypothetical protein n=1 Tax=Pseudomonas aeruginosa TaxID=287 RepID=UPI003D9C69D8
MKKRDFLLPLATLTAAVTANQASASTVIPETDQADESMSIENHGVTLPIVNFGEQMVTGRHGDNLFGFVLKRGEAARWSLRITHIARTLPIALTAHTIRAANGWSR